MAFTLGGSPISGCASVPVTAGAATCTATFAAEASGDVVATYAGTDVLQGAESAGSAFTVAKLATTTSLEVSETEPFTGQVVLLLAHVLGPDKARATAGTVAFTAGGTPIAGCGSVAVSDGYASCTTAWGARATYSVVATYGGTAQQAGSASAASSITVGSLATIEPQAATGTYGLTGATITGRVVGQGRAATGSVTIKSGATVLGTATLNGNGRYTLTLGKTALEPGTRALTVTYGGDQHHGPVTDDTTATIAKAKGTVAVTLTPTNPKVKTQRVTASITVSAPGTVPQGDVRVYVNGKVLHLVKTDANGKATVLLAAFNTTGAKTIRVTFSPSVRVSGAEVTKTVTARS
ncbi:Ig-like domain repeat protein [Aquihabitans sp. G128]|uniref:Ig-like domain repeat protein n=1 Tax=Aquihabitans sp. G128 TaxID=2849779 RepID=UPI001C22ABAE|nr:Ig-like domain repeat protein [Aquihabitans sp. G128]QXC59506.1 Ig-like domain repeat protein [Aquihabitans sp. G128]